jgi:lipopolysaccharide O-acetyltransferase
MVLSNLQKLKGFTFFYLVKMAFMLVYTKLRFGNNIRIIKGLAYILNRGEINWNDACGFTCGIGLRLEVLNSVSKLILSKNIILNDYVHIGVAGTVSLGENCLVGSRVTIIDHDHGDYSDGENCSEPFERPNNRKIVSKDIKIGNNVWLAEGVVILPGSTIGDGSVVGANSIIKGCYPENAVIAGVPAKVIKTYDVETGKWVNTNTLT